MTRVGRGGAPTVAALTLALTVALTLLPMPRQSWGAPAVSDPPQVTTQRGMVAANDRRVIATTRQGREIVARHYGALDAPVQLVAIGQMHGNEPGGRDVTAQLAQRPTPTGVGLWLITSLNPDGNARDTRTNAHGVDLNRNFPQGWVRGTGRGIFWSGPRAASEPETRGIMRFLTAIHPTAVLSYHQAYDVVDVSHPRSRAAGRKLARWMGEHTSKVGCSGACHGTMTQWIDDELKTIAITIELDSRVSPHEANRAAAAVLRLGSWLGR